MKQYDHIDYSNKRLLHQPIYAFDKLDGSNMRFEWSKKRSWYKFGSRRQMIDENHEQFGNVVPMFLNKYGDGLDKIFRKDKNYRNFRSFTVFAEYYGPNSFAGFHQKDDNMELTLFDVNPFGKGFIEPREFVDNFGHLGIPRVIHIGNMTVEFVNDIKNNVFDLTEGSVCKATKKEKGNRIWMTKVKTNNWLYRLKNKYGEERLIDEFN